MKFVQSKDLTVDMVPVRNIYNRRHELLLAANHKLTPKIISRLNDIGHPGLMVYNEYSVLEDYHEYVSEETRNEAVNALMDLSIDKVIFCTNSIVDQILEKEDVLIDMNSDLMCYDSDTYEHSMNVCLLSTACGVVMGLDDRNLHTLAAGAMLHDIGKMSISKDILNKPGKLTEEERNPLNRELCLQANGYTCKICGFDFEIMYGDIGRHFIHVHHIHQLSLAGGPVKIDPVHDLIPVCPNCHAMLHTSTPPLMPDELRIIIKENKKYVEKQ